jgi:peptidoglycan/xylan/chitin deacetylase (PgdA/CDA1 family)
MNKNNPVSHYSLKTGMITLIFIVLFLLSPVVSKALELIPDKLVVLTFDDSVKSHFTVVRSILKKYHFGATFFITEGFDFKTNKQDYMTWDEIAHLHQDGFEIGNHTRGHMSLSPSKPELLKKQLSQLADQIKTINDRCEEYGIPKTVSYAYPGNGIHPDAYPILEAQGIRFARRGGFPEYEYKDGNGFAYEPGFDHPLLIPSAGDARPFWTMKNLKRAVSQAHSGRISVLQFHGVPDKAHPWVDSPVEKFEQYMKYLSDNHFKVIALRDLEKYVDPKNRPGNFQMVIDDRKKSIKNKTDRNNYRKPENDQQLKYWLENMVWYHQFTTEEIHRATGLSKNDIALSLTKYNISPKSKPAKSPEKLTVLPYPGGRHPRTGYLDGAFRPQRETKLSVFSPWNKSEYFVLDIPEAIRRNDEQKHGLLYLAHSHIDTMWTKQGIPLARLEWKENKDGSLEMERTLPNQVVFGTKVFPGVNELKMQMWLKNGSKETLSNLRVQNCIMLKGAPDFCFKQKNDKNIVLEKPFVARRSNSSQQWIITAWTPCMKVWENPPCPCLHSDPQFPDCPPGESRELKGWFSFYEGDDVKKEIARIQSLGWLSE